jgi:hypothetical protein
MYNTIIFQNQGILVIFVAPAGSPLEPLLNNAVIQ